MLAHRQTYVLSSRQLKGEIVVISEFIAGTKGARKRITSFNKLTGTIVLKSASACTLYYVANNRWTPFSVGQAVTVPLDYDGLMSATVDSYGPVKARLVNVLPNGSDGDVLDLSGIGFERSLLGPRPGASRSAAPACQRAALLNYTGSPPLRSTSTLHRMRPYDRNRARKDRRRDAGAAGCSRKDALLTGG